MYDIGNGQKLPFNSYVDYILSQPIHERYKLVCKLYPADRKKYYDYANEAEELIDKIDSPNRAILHSRNKNPFVRAQCKKILNKKGSIFDWDQE